MVQIFSVLRIVSLEPLVFQASGLPHQLFKRPCLDLNPHPSASSVTGVKSVPLHHKIGGR